MDKIANCSNSEKRLSSYYAGAGIVPIGTVGYPAGQATSVPMTGTLALSNFYGSAFVQLSIINGGFELTDNIVDTGSELRLIGWTIYKRKTRLNGFDTILDFPTAIDPTAAYDNTPSPYGDDVLLSTVQNPNPDITATIINTSAPEHAHLASPAAIGKYIIELKLIARLDGPYALTNPNNFGIVRGPILVNNRAFNFSLGDRIQFFWKAEKNEPIGDKYDVFVYLLEIFSGKTIVLLDAKGTTTPWQQVRYICADQNSQGIYKIVFIGGSVDSTGGLSVGAKFYIDDVKVEQSGTFSPPLGLYKPMLGPTGKIPNQVSFTVNDFMALTVVNAPPHAYYSLTVTEPTGAMAPVTGQVDQRGQKIFPTNYLNIIGNYSYTLNFTSNVTQIDAGFITQTLSVSVTGSLVQDVITNPQGFTYLIIPSVHTVMEESLIRYTVRTNDNIDGQFQANIASDSLYYLESNSAVWSFDTVQGSRSKKWVGNGFYEHSFFILTKPVPPGTFLANLDLTKNNQPVSLTSVNSIRVHDITEIPRDTPVMVLVTPNTGTNGSDITVTLEGSGFIHSKLGSMSDTQRKAVTVGGVALFRVQNQNTRLTLLEDPIVSVDFEVISSGKINFKLPLLPQAPASYHIQLMNQNNSPIGLARKNAFSLTASLPVITSRSPSRITELGGNKITITGFGLSTTTAVTIGDQPCTSLIIESDTRVTCKAPRYVRKTNAKEDAISDSSYGQDGLKFYSAELMLISSLGMVNSIANNNNNFDPAIIDYYFSRSPFILKGIERLSVNGGTVTYNGLTDLTAATTANLIIDAGTYACVTVSVPDTNTIIFTYPSLPVNLRNVESIDKLSAAKLKFTVPASYEPTVFPKKNYFIEIPVNFNFDLLPINYILTRNTTGVATIPSTVIISLQITGLPLDTSGVTKVPYRIFGGNNRATSVVLATDVGLGSLTGTFDFTKSSVNWPQTNTVTLSLVNSLRSKTTLITFELVGIPGQSIAIPLLV